MKNILFCWIGFTDLKAAGGDDSVGLGPIGQAASGDEYDEIVLISDREETETGAYSNWLKTKCGSKIEHCTVKLTSPTNFGEIYENAVRVVAETQSRVGNKANFTFHLSPGTPAMAAVWIIIAKTRHPATLIESFAWIKAAQELLGS